MRLTVVLGTHESECFNIILNNNPFVTKWVDELRWCLDHCEFQQQEAFSGNLSLEESAQILTDACVTINRYLKNFIEIQDPLEQTQEYFNYLHLKFEQLSGGFGTPTRLFSVANHELKSAIRNLNFFVHRVETKKSKNIGLYISFNKDQYRRISLSPEDYQYFEFKGDPGTLFLHYAELGKEYIDLYEDNLTLAYTNAKNLHYYSGEASLSYNKYDDVDGKLGYKDWLIKNDIDPYDKTQGHGKIPLGRVEDLEYAKEILQRNRTINKILIE
jgi:C1A family cysteine protease